MSFATRFVVLFACLTLAAGAHGQEKPYPAPAVNPSLDDYFTKEVWPKVGSALCLQCHKKGGDAEESKLILLDPKKLQGHAQDEAIVKNRDAFIKLAAVKVKDQSR